MFAKLRTSMFIDAVQLELLLPKGLSLRGVLRDDKGSICSTVEKDIAVEHELFTWSGLNHLPYGRYTLELSQGDHEMKMSLVKRV